MILLIDMLRGEERRRRGGRNIGDGWEEVSWR